METIVANTSMAGVTFVNDGVGGMMSMQNLGIIIVLTLLVGFALAVLSYAMFSRFAKYLDLAGKTVMDACVGAVAIATLGAIWYVLQQAGQALKSIPPIYYGYAIGGFILCAAVGKITLKAIAKLTENYDKWQKENVKNEVK
jgi:hypothetical protein